MLSYYTYTTYYGVWYGYILSLSRVEYYSTREVYTAVFRAKKYCAFFWCTIFEFCKKMIIIIIVSCQLSIII